MKWWSTKRCALHLNSLRKHCFCHENGKKTKKELSTSLFRRMQVKGEEKKMPGFIGIEVESDSDFEWLYLSAYWGSF